MLTSASISGRRTLALTPCPTPQPPKQPDEGKAGLKLQRAAEGVIKNIQVRLLGAAEEEMMRTSSDLPYCLPD